VEYKIVVIVNLTFVSFSNIWLAFYFIPRCFNSRNS